MRIVAGEFRGRRLAGPDGRAARPTSDKVREALFSILGEVEDARVLDLFAGTGALALEALSRGAAGATLIERDRRMFAVAQRNIDEVLADQSDRAKLIRGDALKLLGSLPGASFDLVLIDPPYADAETIAPKLASALPALLAPRARVVVESDRRAPLELAGRALTQAFERNYGDTLIRIFDAL
ncbi:MAG: 16S rRNA (guanine(966)-N(2))-methyltransferase RsmD [Solirubrobacterales bacterium]